MGCLDELIHILKQLVRSYTGVNLCRLNVTVSQHPADGFNGYAFPKLIRLAKECLPA